MIWTAGLGDKACRFFMMIGIIRGVRRNGEDAQEIRSSEQDMPKLRVAL
jgi:hypothetical protein